MSPPAGSHPRLDAVVVGGGPAGASAALHLARASLRVAVIDGRSPPRYKTCGGGLVGRARRALEADLAPVVERECRVAEMRIADLSFRVTRDEPLVSMTMRAALDHRLLEAAVDAGADLIAPCRLVGLDTTAGGLRLDTDRGPIRSRYVVAADGALSPTARAAGWPENRHRVGAVESEVRVGGADLERLGGSAMFELGLPAHGYAWVFPKRSHLSIGCLSTRRGDGSLRQNLERYLDRLGLASIEGREDHGFVIPFAPRCAELARERVLLAGDAAGLADPVTGEGISHALASGRIAAEALAQSPERPGRVATAYRLALEREILRELRLARVLARLLYDRVRLRVALFRRAGRALCECMAEVVSGGRSYRELVGNPLNYFRLALCVARGSGAGRGTPG